MSLIDKKERIKTHVPGYFNASINRNWKAILEAIASEDNAIVEQIKETKNQLYIKFADGKFLDVLAANVGVYRTITVPQIDDQFRDFIPIMSFLYKQIRSTIYEALEVFWGENSTRANLSSLNSQAFSLVGGEVLDIDVDDRLQISIIFKAEDFELPGSATAQEVATAITSRGKEKIFAEAYRDLAGDYFVRLRTNTRGQLGSIKVLGGTANAILNFPTDIVENTEIAIYEINHKELIIKIPHTLPLITNSLRGTHHFHETEDDLYDTQPPTSANPYWPGSFIYNPLGTYEITSKKTILNEVIQQDNIAFVIEVDDSSQIPNERGFLVFNFGNPKEERPIPYLSRPNNNSLMIDPAYIFRRTHAVGDEIHFITVPARVPRMDGFDYSVYITNTSDTEALTLEVVKKLIAAGIVLRLSVIRPHYLFETISC